MHAYPKASHADLGAAIGEMWDLESEQVWLAPGADGAIDYLSRAMLAPGDSVLVPDPGFAYYPMSARYHHGTVREYKLSKEADFAQSAATVMDAYEGDRVVYVTTPHNPTGSAMSLADVEALAAETDEQTLVVVDEAYGEFSETESARTLLDEREDVAVLRTFSKAYGLAGVRAGYALVPPAWADAYAAINTPFAVNELACRAALAAVDDPAHVQHSVESAVASRRELGERLEAPVVESEANFVLVEVGDAAAVTRATKRRGVIVRDCSSFGLSGYVRVTCGTPDETDRAVTALNEALREVESRA